MIQSQDGAQNHYRKPEQGTESLSDESGAVFVLFFEMSSIYNIYTRSIMSQNLPK